MKKTINGVITALLLLGAALGLVACGDPNEQGGNSAGGGGQTTVYVYNWTDYIDPEVYRQFEAETGIRVIEDNFSSNEEALAKLQAGGTGYDIIVPSDYMIEIMIQQDLLLPLNKSNIPNLANVQDFVDEFLDGDPYFDPGMTYCVPYMYGTTGIGISSSVENAAEINSWGYLFDPALSAQFAGRITMMNDSRELVGAALQYLGYSRNTTNEDELMAARDLLLRQREWVYAYDSDQFEIQLITNDALIAQAWNGDILFAQEEDPDLTYVIPQEGGTFYLEALCIPKGARNKDAAEQLINYILEGEVGAQLVEYLYYASPNSAALAFLDPELLNNPAIFPPEEIRNKLEGTFDLGDLNRVYEDIFSEVISR